MPSQGEYYEAVCKDIDPIGKKLVCCFPKDTGFAEACFQISYDVLIVGVSCREKRQERRQQWRRQKQDWQRQQQQQ